MFVKSEVNSNDITECSHDDQPMTGMLTSTDSLFSPFISYVYVDFLLFCLLYECVCVLYYLLFIIIYL